MSREWEKTAAPGRGRHRAALIGAGAVLAAFTALSAWPGPSAGPSAAGVVGAHEWWNEDWCKLLSLDGAWELETEGAAVRLRPEHDDCHLALLSVVSGQVVDYPMTTAGEVVLFGGWVMVNQLDRLTITAPSPPGAGAADCHEDGVVTNHLNRAKVERIAWTGGGGWVCEDLQAEGFVFARALAGAEGSVALYSYSGAVDHYAGEAGGTLRVTQYDYAGEGRGSLCVCD